MAAFDEIQNLATSLVATAPSPATTGTSLVVTAGQGARFPSVFPYNLTIWPPGADPDPSNAEIVTATARATDTLTIVRAQEGTTARSVVVGDKIALTMTKARFTVSLSARSYSVRDFRVVGVGDETVGIQAAIDAASPDSGAVIDFEGKVYTVNTPGLLVTKSGVELRGKGAAFGNFAGSFNGTPSSGTILRCTSGFAGAMLAVAPVSGAGNPALKGFRLRDIAIDCASITQLGLVMQSCQGAIVDGLHIANATVIGMALGTVAALNEIRTLTRCMFGLVSVWCNNTDAEGVRLDGDAADADTGGCEFGLLQIIHKNGIGLRLMNCDSNVFRIVYAGGIGTGVGVVFEGSNASIQQVARDNIIQWVSANGGILAKGTASYTYPSNNNEIWVVDDGSTHVRPTIEAGAGFVYRQSHGFDVGPGISLITSDADVTLTAGLHRKFVLWTVPLAANRVITLSTVCAGAAITLPPATSEFTVVRAASASGSSTLTVDGKVLAVGEWAHFVFDGTSWRLVGFGSL